MTQKKKWKIYFTINLNDDMVKCLLKMRDYYEERKISSLVENVGMSGMESAMIWYFMSFFFRLSAGTSQRKRNDIQIELLRVVL